MKTKKRICSKCKKEYEDTHKDLIEVFICPNCRIKYKGKSLRQILNFKGKWIDWKSKNEV